MAYAPSAHLFAIILIFGVAYTYHVVQKLRCREVDLYDFVLLLSVAAIPLVFVGWPRFTAFVGEVFGVALPLTVMFGLLFVSVFVILHRSLSRIHRLETQVIALTQEVALIDDRVANGKPVFGQAEQLVSPAGADAAARR
jgi:hypothetical protein